jgi:hypothetical protein
MAKQKKEQTAQEIEAKRAAKRNRFVKVGTQRVNKAVKSIRLIGNLAKPNAYSFTAADVQDLKAVLVEETKKVLDRFTSALEGKTQTAEVTFQFGAAAQQGSKK